MTLTILIAPSAFKDILPVDEVIRAISDGVRRAMPTARILSAPMVNGGEGTVAALVAASWGETIESRFTGPLGTPVAGYWGLLGGNTTRTAVIETAAATGMSLVPEGQRDPMAMTSFGVGELIKDALDAGVERILIGCDDTEVSDGGAGLARALGAKLLDGNGKELEPGAGPLSQLRRVDLDGLDPRLCKVKIDVAVNWQNQLLGPRGVARRLGQGKSAAPYQTALLEASMTRWAACLRATTGVEVAKMPGAGASGGIAAGLAAITGATLYPRYGIILDYLNFNRMLDDADLVITADGAMEALGHDGKAPGEVGRRAHARGVPAIALAGLLDSDRSDPLSHGISAFAPVRMQACCADHPIESSAAQLRRGTENALRMMGVGLRLSDSPRAAM